MIVHADLHVHSKYSGISPDWYSQLARSLDSYTEPEDIFACALHSGLTYVTITDHDQISGSLLLKERYPDQVFTGVEFSVYFPEDQCKVHILVYGLTIKDYENLMNIRQDIYQFREYLKKYNLTYSVAHALMALNRKLARHHLEKLILLFDVFEGINGSQLKVQNQTWVNYLHRLNPSRIEDLYKKYRIEPISHDPWVKGFTGGSDDHAGLSIGRAYTKVKAGSMDEFLASIRQKQSVAVGLHSTFYDLSMSVLKIGLETARKFPNSKINNNLSCQTINHVFNKKPSTPAMFIQLEGLKLYNHFRPDPIRILAASLIEKLNKEDFTDVNTRSKKLYDCLTLISDEAICQLVSDFSGETRFKLDQFIDKLKSPLAGIFLSIPFYTVLGFMNASRHLINDLGVDYQNSNYLVPNNKRILWFSDSETISGLVNGIYDPEITFVTIKHDQQITHKKQVLLPVISHLAVGKKENQVIPIPSILRSLGQLADLEPDEIIISSTGPVGIIGLILSKLLKIPCVGIPQDNLLTWQMQLFDNPQAEEWVKKYIEWFFSQVNQVIETNSDFVVPVGINDQMNLLV